MKQNFLTLLSDQRGCGIASGALAAQHGAIISSIYLEPHHDPERWTDRAGLNSPLGLRSKEPSRDQRVAQHHAAGI